MHATAKEMNCSKHCIKCDTHGECIGCEVGFYGSTCESRCLLDCGTRGCQQNTGKCNGMHHLALYNQWYFLADVSVCLEYLSTSDTKVEYN